MPTATSPAARMRNRITCTFHLIQRFAADRSGNYALVAAIVGFPILVGVAVAIEYANAVRLRSELQQVLDAAVLGGATEEDGEIAAAHLIFKAHFEKDLAAGQHISASFQLGDGVLDGQATRPMQMSIGLSILAGDRPIAVRSQARFRANRGAPCITILADTHDALRVNSGANVSAASCEIHVHSRMNTAAFVGAGSRLQLEKLCVRGSNTRIHGIVSREEKNCDVKADPFVDRIPEPEVPAGCTTSGAKDGARHTLKPGVHCNVNFNGSPTVTFEPGLHIIKGDMNINAGSMVMAEGVTFYFPDTTSRIQANGSLKMTASAPTAGPYKGILMFEKTSDSANNAKKSPFVFNGSAGEQLTGVIHLPNRDVTYNSTTNISGTRLSLVANTMIINSANWALAGLEDAGGGARSVVLSR